MTDKIRVRVLPSVFESEDSQPCVALTLSRNGRYVRLLLDGRTPLAMALAAPYGLVFASELQDALADLCPTPSVSGLHRIDKEE